MNSQIVQGKGNLLDIVREYDASLTGNYLRINGNDPEMIEKARGFMQEGKRYLLRSDATCEDGRGATFAGLFNSIIVRPETFIETAEGIYTPHNLATLNPLKLQEYFTTFQREGQYQFGEKVQVSLPLEEILGVINSTDGVDLLLKLKQYGKFHDRYIFDEAINIVKYAKLREVSMLDSRMDFILHEYYDFNQVLIMEHPNYEGLMHAEILFTDRTGHDCSNSVDFFIEDKDRFRNIYDVPGLGDIVSHYQELMKDPRVDKNYSYVMEAGVEPTRIVQLRPFLKKELVKIDRDEFRIDESPRIASILGNIPQQGIIFEYDSNTQSYPGLLVKKRKFDKEDLPYDITENQKIKVMIEHRCSQNQYLEHAGLLNLESLISYDNGLISRGELKYIWGADKIRYFQTEPGNRRFEVVE